MAPYSAPFTNWRKLRASQLPDREDHSIIKFMRKVMLVVDDYQEMVAIENLLCRLGFDVLSLGKDILVNDALYRFQPEIVIATSKGHSVDGYKVAERMKRIFPPPKVALTYSGGIPPALTPKSKMNVDGLIATPILPQNLIKLVARLGDLDPEPLLEKFQKIMSAPMSQKDLELVRVFGQRESLESWDPVKTPGQAASLRSARSNRYDEFLQKHADEVPQQKVLPREKALAAMEELKADSLSEAMLLEEIHREKIKFVKTLFGESAANEKKLRKAK